MSKNILIQEYVSAVKESRHFLKESRDRGYNETQIKLTLKQQIILIKTSFNQIILAEQPPGPEELFESLINLITVFDEIILILPKLKSFEEELLEFSILRITTLSYLTSIHNFSLPEKYHISANVLEQLLSGLIKKDVNIDEIFPLKAHTFKKLVLTLNYLKISAIIYKDALDRLLIIPEKSALEWARIGFSYYRQVWKIIQHIDFNEYYKIYQENYNPSSFFNNLLYMLSTFSSLTIFLRIVYCRLGAEKFSHLDTSELLISNDVNGILDISEKILVFITKTIDRMIEVYSNENALEAVDFYESPIFKQLMIHKHAITFHVSHLQFSKDLISNNNNLDFLDNKTLSSLNDAIDKLKNLLMDYITFVQGKEKLITSTMLDFYSGYLYFGLGLVNLQAISKKEKEIYFTFLKEYGEWLFKDLEPSKYPDLFISKYLTELKLAIKLNDIDLFRVVKNEIDNNSDSFAWHPLHYLSIKLLKLLLNIISYQQYNESILQEFQAMKQEIIIEKGLEYLQNDFERYFSEIFKSLSNIVIDYSLLEYRTLINPLDQITLLIPDLKIQFPNFVQTSIRYIPFNRACDRIVPENE